MKQQQHLSISLRRLGLLVSASFATGAALLLGERQGCDDGGEAQ